MKVVWHMKGAKKMLQERGLEPEGRVQQVFTHTLAREMDSYVPMQDGTLKNGKLVAADSVTYPGPYARYQYYGKLMVAPNGSSWAHTGERKHRTNRNLTYNGAPMRGAFWDKRCWQDKKDKIVAAVAKAAGGEPNT